MNMTTKIIVTDTNIITDLNNAKILQEFVNLDNVYICDLIKYDEINYIVARDSKSILATKDNALKKYAESNGIEVIRT